MRMIVSRTISHVCDVMPRANTVNAMTLSRAYGRLASQYQMPMRRFLSTEEVPERDHTHFKVSAHKHPLETKKKFADQAAADAEEMKAADHTGRQQNHIWSNEELDEAMTTLYRHQPKTFSDHLMNKLVSPFSCHLPRD